MLSRGFIKEKPIGLKKIFGNWKTVYQGLFNLPKKAKKSWFSFDHYYSDLAFDEVMPILFEHTPETLFDIGGNTGKLAAKCLLQDPNVKLENCHIRGLFTFFHIFITNLKFAK